jgi:hypothetical protein
MLRDIDRGDSCLDGPCGAGYNTAAADPGKRDIARAPYSIKPGSEPDEGPML